MRTNEKTSVVSGQSKDPRKLLEATNASPGVAGMLHLVSEQTGKYLAWGDNWYQSRRGSSSWVRSSEDKVHRKD